MKIWATFGVALGALCIAANEARAGTIYDSGPPITQGQRMDLWVQASDFSFSTSTTVTDVRFWNSQTSSDAYAGSVEWVIYADGGGQPGSVIYQGSATAVVRSEVDLGTQLSYQNDFSIGEVYLTVGTYWLGLHNGPIMSSTQGVFGWHVTSAVGNDRATLVPSLVNSGISFGNGYWASTNRELAFQLSGYEGAPSGGDGSGSGGSGAPIVPLPPSALMGLTLLGGLGLATVLRNHRRATPA